VFQNLLREQVSIRDAASILEALAEAGVSTRNPVMLTEFVRQSIRRAVVEPYLNKAGELPGFFVDAGVEKTIESAVEHSEQNSHLSASPEVIRDVLGRFSRAISKPDGPTVVLVSSAVRYFMRQMAEGTLPNLVFIAHNEVPAEVRVVNLGLVR